jgi:hypothetical protein
MESYELSEGVLYISDSIEKVVKEREEEDNSLAREE